MVRRENLGVRRIAAVALMALGAGLLVTVAGSSSADVTAVTGSALAAEGHISLFKGPVMDVVPSSPVTFPPGGTATPDSTKIDFGPATFIRTGPATIASNGTTDSVTSSTSFTGTPANATTPCLFAFPADFTAGSGVVTSATANFTSEDVGKIVSNANLPVLLTGEHKGEQTATILSVESPTSATISSLADTTATGSYLTINREVGTCIYNSQFTADTAGTTCTANAAGTTGSTHFTNGKLVTLTDNFQDPTAVMTIPDDPEPNLTVDGTFFLTGTPEPFRYIFNEQVVDPTTGALTVTAAHLIALDPGTAVGDVYLGRSTCGATVTGGDTTTTKAGGTTTTTKAGGTTTTTKAGGTTTTTKPSGTTTTTTKAAPNLCDTVATSTTSPTAAVSPTSVAPGDHTDVSSQGFKPNESVDITLCSTPVKLTTVSSDPAGDVKATVTIPSGTAVGSHTVVISNASLSRIATATLTVAAASDGGGGGGTTGSGTGGALSRTGADSARMVWFAGLALLLGVCLLRASRIRRWPSSSAPWNRRRRW